VGADEDLRKVRFMKSTSTFPTRGQRLLASVHAWRIAPAVLALLFLANLSLASSLPASESPVPINIGTGDDPYYVDSAALEAIEVEASESAAEAAASSVARLGSWSIGLTHTPGSGSNRLLVFTVGYENSSDVGVGAVSYGGQALTRIGGVAAGTSSIVRTELWYLKEAGIAAASTNTFTVTWGGSTPSSPKYGAATYANVSQTTPINRAVQVACHPPIILSRGPAPQSPARGIPTPTGKCCLPPP
jgi:hypothetical protein